MKVQMRNSKTEALALFAASYPLAIGLSNAALLFDTLDYAHDTKQFAESDARSTELGAIASRLAGYPVTVACLDEIPTPMPKGYDRFGEVRTYKVIDPLINTHYLSLNPRNIRMRSSECDAVLEDQSLSGNMTDRQDNFVSYAVLIHEIEHLENPADQSESSVQCRAIASMPARLAQVGFSAEDARVATGYADAQSMLRLSPEYRDIDC